MGINLIQPTEFTSGILIADTFTPLNGSPGSLPPMTRGLDNPSAPASAALEIQSTEGALVLPRLMNTDITELNKTPGMLFYSTEGGCISFCDNTGSIATVTGSGTVTSINIATSGTGVTFSGGPITGSGTITATLDATLQGISDLVTEGIIIRKNSETVTRAIATANAANITIANATGVDGDPTIDLAATGVTAGTYFNSNIVCDDRGRILTIASGAGGSGAPSDATYIVQTSNAFLSNEQVLASLATGIVKNTTGTGVLSIAVAGTDYYSSGNPTRIINDDLIQGNFFIGKDAGNLTYTSAQFNTGVGTNCLNAITTGIQNTFAGYASGILLTTGRFNSGFGQECLAEITTNDSNSAFGFNAANALATGSGVVAIGESAMSACASATNCIAIGKSTVVGNGLTNAVAIGATTTISVSNAINLGNDCKVGINNASPAYSLDIANGTTVASVFIADNGTPPSIPTGGSVIWSQGGLVKVVTTDGIYNTLNPFREILSVTGTTKTFGLADTNKFQRCNNASTQTLTVPANSTDAFPIGTEIDVYQEGAGQVVFAAAGGVTIQSAFSNLKIAAQYTGATLKKLDTDTWSLVGNLTA